MNLLVESTDGGRTWKGVATAAGMKQSGGTASIHFIDTGVAASTRHDMVVVRPARRRLRRHVANG